jgi:hypothetical protein
MYGIALGFIVIPLHIRFFRKGRMRFEAAEWSHATEGMHGIWPGGIAVLRLAYSAFILATTIVALLVESSYDVSLTCNDHILATFTVWSWMTIGFYGFLSGLASALNALGFRPSEAAAKYAACGLWVLFETMATMACLVFLTVWMILVPADPSFMDPHKVLPFSMHNLNICIVAAEVFFNRFKFVPHHAVFVIYYLGVYMVFTWMFFLATNQFCYFFVDWRSWVFLPGYTAMITFSCGSFALMTLVINRLKGSLDAKPECSRPCEPLLSESIDVAMME